MTRTSSHQENFFGVNTIKYDNNILFIIIYQCVLYKEVLFQKYFSVEKLFLEQVIINNLLSQYETVIIAATYLSGDESFAGGHHVQTNNEFVERHF